jgi:SAM-dependent methyltransferase
MMRRHDSRLRSRKADLPDQASRWHPSHVAEPEKGEILNRPPQLAKQFNRIADDYDARPGYPGWVFDILVERCGLGPGAKVLEIGPGTGQATLPMLDRGARVTAVEPGAALARRLAERTTGRDVIIVPSGFEDVEVSEATFDLVASATAFHWVEVSIGLRKAAQALRDGGWFTLWWTIWGDPDRHDPFHEALAPVLGAKAPHLLNDEHGSRAYIRDLAARATEVERVGYFGPVQHEVLRWDGDHDPKALRRMFATFAGWIALPEPLRTELLDDVEHLAREDFGGVVHRPYQTLLYLAERLPR